VVAHLTVTYVLSQLRSSERLPVRRVVGCWALALAEVLASHALIHAAEGELFREVLIDGAHACGLALTTLPDKTALDAAAQRLRIPRAQLDAQLVALGKSVGPPWGQHQKEAAAAALVALQS
jgi:hypothetical protein